MSSAFSVSAVRGQTGGGRDGREPTGPRLVCPGMNAIERWSGWLSRPQAEGPAAILILRLMAGGVFLSEGILKFLYANQGVGRFTKLGFPVPGSTATFVAIFEIGGGLLLIAGLATRFIALAFVLEMIVAILTTKVSLFLGTSPLAPPPAPPTVGFWAVMHESRSDYAQLMTCLFLALVGPGIWSLDARRAGRRE